MCSLRLEKGYRDYGVDIENTDDPLVAGLAFTDLVGQARRVRRTRGAGEAPRRPVRADGARAARRPGAAAARRRAAAAATVSGSATSARATTATRSGASVGLAVVEHEAGVTADWLAGDGFEVDIAGARVPATLSLRPFYDPDRLRIRS